MKIKIKKFILKQVVRSVLIQQTREDFQKHFAPQQLRIIKKFARGDVQWYDMSQRISQKLYRYYADSGEMPYGTMKARTGDPDQWIAQRLQDMYRQQQPQVLNQSRSIIKKIMQDNPTLVKIKGHPGYGRVWSWLDKDGQSFVRDVFGSFIKPPAYVTLDGIKGKFPISKIQVVRTM